MQFWKIYLIDLIIKNPTLTCSNTCVCWNYIPFGVQIYSKYIDWLVFDEAIMNNKLSTKQRLPLKYWLLYINKTLPLLRGGGGGGRGREGGMKPSMPWHTICQQTKPITMNTCSWQLLIVMDRGFKQIKQSQIYSRWSVYLSKKLSYNSNSLCSVLFINYL